MSSSFERQRWLERVVIHLRQHFHECWWNVPDNIKVSVGIPKGMHGSKKAIGQCWSDKASSDGFYEIFSSPELGKEVEVIATMAHELVHATVGIEAGHKGKFKQCAIAIGLAGKMTATVAGDGLIPVINKIISMVGPYPAGKLNINNRKKVKTYMIKCQCPECGYTVRTTAQWLAQGDPICPVDNVGMN